MATIVDQGKSTPKRVGFSPIPAKSVGFAFAEPQTTDKKAVSISSDNNNTNDNTPNNNTNDTPDNGSGTHTPKDKLRTIEFNNFTSNIKLVDVDDEASFGNEALNRYNPRTPSFSVSMWSTKSAYHMRDEQGNRIKRPKTPAIIRHARMDSVSQMKQLIDEGRELGIDIINTIDINTGKTPLIQAAMFGNLKTLEFLITEQKADVNYVPDDDDNDNNDKDKDEDGDGGDKDGDDYDEDEGLGDIGGNSMHLINQNKSALQWAISRQHYDVIALLLKHGAKVKHQDMEGWTSLHYSVFKRDLKITRMLLEKDKTVMDIKDEFGYTSLERLVQWIEMQDSMTSEEKENVENLLDLLTGMVNWSLIFFFHCWMSVFCLFIYVSL